MLVDPDGLSNPFNIWICLKAMYPINYNFFSSYGPSYDSTFSNLTLEETQLVQTGVRYSKQTEEYADIIRFLLNLYNIFVCLLSKLACLEFNVKNQFWNVSNPYLNI